MIRPPVRLAPTVAAAAALAFALAPAAPLAAQDGQGTFSLPPATPTPAPAPAGPADERAGVAIPPRPVPTATPAPLPTVAPSPVPTLAPQPEPTADRPAPPRPVPTGNTPPARPESLPAPAPVPTATAAPQEPPPATAEPTVLPPTLPGTLPDAMADIVPDGAAAPSVAPGGEEAWPDWWPYAAGGLGALALLGAGVLLWRRRTRRPLRLAAPSRAAAARGPESAPDLTRLDIALEITGATRSLMRFTLAYRLTVANRSERAVSDLSIAAQLACARASAGSGPSAGAAQSLAAIARVGPGQAQSVTGEVQLPLSAIQPLRQGMTPLFIPLVHVTLEGEGQPALTRTFVVGPRSASGRVHPIALDGPPGGIAGLVAQGVAVPPASAAA